MNLRLIAVTAASLLATSACSDGAVSERPSAPSVAQTAAPTKGSAEHIRAATGAIDGETIVANAATTADWPSHGLDYAETRFSKLTALNADNVKNLGLVWSYDLASTRGVEATPLVVDGIMYVTASWSVVHAVDVRTGKNLWTYDPKVPREIGYKGCCDVVNRGVAIHKGKVYLGAFDGRLIALEAATGAVVWEKNTVLDPAKPYTITGAPRVFNGKVLIGNGGAEYGVRGYVTAYDAETGDQKWRFFTVPGDPSKPFESEALAAAAKTWDPAGQWWINGGGGTVWDTITFDPELNHVYIGTGNGSPWSQKRRSPAGGDNLYLASVVAIDADTGAYVWHYQETPSENADYTSTQPMILADIKLDGADRKVILHAPKNGFFYVIDRQSGKLISAKNYVDVNWASGYDADGRPIETKDARPDGPFDSIPGALGAHNWQSMSYSPQTGLVYIPVHNVPITMVDDKDWKQGALLPNRVGSGVGWNTGFVLSPITPKSVPFGRLVAWDPVAQREVWRHEHVSPWNGGTLATAGNLVFQGSADGHFAAYDAARGTKLWETSTGGGVIAAPVTYLVDGKQYVSIAVGWGGSYGLSTRVGEGASPGTVFTFALDGKAAPPAFVTQPDAELLSGVQYDPALVQEGAGLYVASCVLCHGVPGVARGGNINNLGYVAPNLIENLDRVLFGGLFKSQGMPDFTGVLRAEDVPKLKAFIQSTAEARRATPAVP